jgi:hypothetical protein
VERALGARLERATRSDEFAGLVTGAATIGAGLRSAYERATAGALHRANLPAWSDLRVLAEQMTGLERRVADLALELERRRDDGAARRRSSPRRRPPSAR